MKLTDRIRTVSYTHLDNIELFADFRVLCDFGGKGADQLDDLFSKEVARSSLCTENIGFRDKVGVRVDVYKRQVPSTWKAFAVTALR